MKSEAKTKDIYTAAAWLSLGAELVSVNKDDVRHQVFIFNPHGVDTEKISQDFVNEKLMVNAVDYKNALQRLKSIIHSF